MTDRDDEEPYREAAEWHARVDADDMDWRAFGQWLEADDRHQRAYDQLALIEKEVSDWSVRHDGASQDNDPLPSKVFRPRRWLAGSIAAALVAMVSIPMLTRPGTSPDIYYTADAGQKEVQLSDGSSARLDRGTRIAVGDGGKGPIRLERGAAYFDVRHDPSRPFTVQSGDLLVRDIGTRFSVTRQGESTSVAVAQGVVDVSWRGAQATQLQVGKAYQTPADGDAAEVRDIDPTMVASWRQGRLVYDNAPLSVVAADISRYTSEPVAVEPAVANLKLSGMLSIEDGSHLVDQIQAILPVEVRHEDHQIRLVRVPARR